MVLRINVKGYGAIGNGITDDTLSVQKAFEQGGKVYIPEGDYRITKTLLVKSDTIITAHEKQDFYVR